MRKQQRMLGINTKFLLSNRNDFTQISFSSHHSFFDFDAVVINTRNLVNQYHSKENLTYENKLLLSKSNSMIICDDYKRIKQQIIDYLTEGKYIYLLMGQNQSFFIYTKAKNYMTGQFDDYITNFDVYSFLPISINETYIHGQEIHFCSHPPYKEFFEKIADFTQYAVYYTAHAIATPLAKIKDSENVVSSAIEYSNGKIICLPQPNFISDSNYTTYWKDHANSFLDSLFELNARLQAPEAVVIPAWAESISILDESHHIDAKNQIINDIAELERNLHEEEDMIRHIQNYKNLIASRGTALEEITKQILSELGFMLFDTEPGRDDIIAKYNDIDIVAEIKGVKNSAAEKHAAQLEKWVSTFLEKNERTPKPILIVNGYCETPLQERKDPVFPDQMIPYSTSRNHALLSTTQLLCLYIEIQINPSVKEDRIKELLETVGVYQRYDDISQYIKCVNETGETND